MMSPCEREPGSPCYTPGPWHLERQREGQQFTAIGEPIAVIGGEATGESVEFIVGRTCDFGPHGADMTEANARLICAAPELLEACKLALAELHDLRPPNVRVVTIDGCQNPNVAELLERLVCLIEGKLAVD